MRKLSLAFGAAVLGATATSGQPVDNSKTSHFEYRSVAAALEALRTKSGVRVAMQGGWTIIDEKATMSVWSFTPPEHPAHPAAVRRTVVQEGNDVFIHMNVLCEAEKRACDKLVAEFQELNDRMRETLRKRAP